MLKALFAFIIALVPIALWGIVFSSNNPRRQTAPEIVRIFILGMISIIPVIYFHQWLLGDIIKSLMEAWPFLATPFIRGCLELSLATLFMAAFIFAFSFLRSAGVWLLYGFSFAESFSAAYRKLYSVSPVILIFALLLIIDAALNLGLKTSLLISATGSTIVFAILEEYFKYIINPFLAYRKINSIGTAMVDAMYVGLAFAFVENCLFFYFNFDAEGFWQIVIFRSLITTLLHVCASGLLGYFYGLSVFSKVLLADHEIEKRSYKVPLLLKGFLGKENTHQIFSVTRGFFAASFGHVLFNLLLTFGYRGTAAGLAIFSIILIFLILRTESSQMQYGLIGSKALPQEDYEKLRLKIAVLKQIKEIQAMRRG